MLGRVAGRVVGEEEGNGAVEGSYGEQGWGAGKGCREGSWGWGGEAGRVARGVIGGSN